MRIAEVRKLIPGIYIIHWKGTNSGASFAAVGVTANGERWLAPVNWLMPTCTKSRWRLVESVVLVVMEEMQ